MVSTVVKGKNGILNTLIIWDWNGTLLDDMDACILAVNVLLGNRELPTLDPETYRETFRFPVIDYYRTIGFDLEREPFEILADEYVDLYRETAKQARLQEGAVEALSRFRSMGCRQMILSAMESAALRRHLDEYGVSRFFDSIVGSGNIQAHGKIGIAREFFRESGVPERTVLIGDTYHDYEVAASLECRCVLVKNGHQNLDRFDFDPRALLIGRLSDLQPDRLLSAGSR